MYFFTGNEVLMAIGKDSLYDPAESLAYTYEVLDDGKRYRFHLRQGVQFQGGYGEMTAADVAWSKPSTGMP
jgi:peptide/nickel transport system substrate-binding protein